ncbi:guanylate cyclase [Legionella gratiana]|uniref:Guanylate cyclase n=1 Tax=Legionella gratiana TaxID=45066 RepID=A0A378JC02_9GAMM|nr:adenylate/guanylate cyclase domain-containing protein [Legionella gratiana]KTD05503.1 guanylate cyclase [Legionella gratiana]STX45404.1 guanylate cyclase [Legionella gratiana]
MDNTLSIKNMESKNFYKLLFQIYRDAGHTSSLKEILTMLIDVTSCVIGCERGTIFLNDPKTGELYSFIAQGDLNFEIRILNNSGLAGWSFTHNESLCIDHPELDERHNKNIDKITGFQTKSVLCVPLKSMEGKLLGVTQMLNKIDSDFNSSDVRIVEALTEHAAMAIQNKLTIEQIEESHKRDMHLLETISTVSTEINLSALLEKIIDTITLALDAERATLFINDDKTNELYTEASIGLNKMEIRFPNHLGIAGSTFTTGKIINIPHAYVDLRFNPSFDKKTGFFTRSILSAPVRNKSGKIIGVTQVLNKKHGEFTTDDEYQLIAINSQISIAIENAKLFEEVQNIKNYNESILESMTSTVITLNETNQIVTCNKAGMKLLHLSNIEELVLKHVSILFQDDKNNLIERITTINSHDSQLNHDTLMDIELNILGTKITANVNIVPLISVNKERLGVIMIIEDISSEKRMKTTMSRYMSSDLAEKLLQSNEFSLGGTNTLATILFSDIRDFTSISESFGAEETVKVLNKYFSLMVDCIHEESGILDKFIGDAIMAVFGSPFPHEDDPDRAVRAAIAMMKALNNFNQKRNKRGLIPIKHGIGINTDKVVAGNIGSEKRMDFTVIGDGVNLASRVESLCKYYGAHILISEFTYQQLKSTYRTRQIDKVIVKGKVNPVSIYEIIDFHDKHSFPNQIDVLNHFNNGIEFYNEALWDKAILSFQHALRLYPEDKPSQLYIKRCRILKEHPPEPNWQGIWKMKNK